MNTPTPFMHTLDNSNVITANLTIGQLDLLRVALRDMCENRYIPFDQKEEVEAMINMFAETIKRDKAGDIPTGEIQGYCY